MHTAGGKKLILNYTRIDQHEPKPVTTRDVNPGFPGDQGVFSLMHGLKYAVYTLACTA